MTHPFALLANQAADALTLPLTHQAVSAEQIVSGSPTVGSMDLGELGGCRIGVWEMTPGVSTDVEVDEYFIVLSGRATVTFADGTPALNLQPGSVGRLAAGTATTWTITETLRKVYLA